jgi:hypothetical protein
MQRIQRKPAIDGLFLDKIAAIARWFVDARGKRHDRTMIWATLVVAALTLVACEALQNARPDIIRNTGLGDRCADYMRLSYPGARIDVRIQHVDVANTRSGGLGLMIVDVEGLRPDIPASGGFLANEVAARCRFENGILTQFRWTKGPFR